MKKYEEICGKYEIRILPIYGPWDLEKFRAHRLISGRGGGGDSQFPGLGVPHRKDMKHVKTRRSASVKILLTSCLSFNTQPGLQTASLPSQTTYGVQVQGAITKSDREVVQRAQNKVLRCIAQATWFVSNNTVHRIFCMDTVCRTIQYIVSCSVMDTVEETTRKAADKYSYRLLSHPNVEVIQLLDDSVITRRLKRLTPSDLMQSCNHHRGLTY